jgi:hypothetical protein
LCGHGSGSIPAYERGTQGYKAAGRHKNTGGSVPAGRRRAGNVKQDFYAVTTVSDMLSGGLRVSDEKTAKGKTKKRGREYRAGVSRAAGVLKDRLAGLLITDDGLARKYLYREPVIEIRRRTVPVRPNRGVTRKEYLKKPRFHHNHKSNCWPGELYHPVNLLTGGGFPLLFIFSRDFETGSRI